MSRSVSLVIPAHNEEAALPLAIAEADRALAALVENYEILVVDDGSSDNTFQLACQLVITHPRTQVLRLSANLGYGAALRAGFAAAQGELIAFTDADCQFDLSELDRMLLLAERHDIVCGYRIARHEGWRREWTSKTYNALARLLFGIGTRDCDCALKVFRREVAQAMAIETDGFFVNVELLAKARWQNHSLVEVGVTHRARVAGESKISLRQVAPVASAMARFWWSNHFRPEGEADAGQRIDCRRAGAWSFKQELGCMALVALAAWVMLFSRLGYPLIEPDETRYAQIAAEMLESGDWITPTLVGRPYLDKPPLLYWATTASYRLFGVNEWAARFPGALSAWLTIGVTYLLGRRLFGGRAACLGALGLLLCGGFVLSGRFLLMDGLLTLATTVTLLAGFLAVSGTRIHNGWLALASLACAMGVMIKGPIAVALCLPPLIAWRWLSNDRPRLSLRQGGLLAAVFALATLPWFAAVACSNPGYASYFLWKHHIVRFFHAFHHAEPWWYYLPVLVAGAFPLSILFPGLMAFAWQQWRSPPSERRRSLEVGYLLLCAAWIVCFFSLSSCKLPTYVLPAFPMFCLLAGCWLDGVGHHERQAGAWLERLRGLPRRLTASLVVVVTIAGLIDWSIFPLSNPSRVVSFGVWAFAMVCLAMVWRLTRAGKSALGRPALAWAPALALAFVAMGFSFWEFVPRYSQARSIHLLAAEIQRGHGHPPVVYFDRQAYSATLHVDRKSFHYFDGDQLTEASNFVRAHEMVVLVALPDSVEWLQDFLGAEVAFQPVDSRGQIYLTRRRPAGPGTLELVAQPSIGAR